MQQGFVMRTPRGRILAEFAYRHLDRRPPARLAQLALVAGENGHDGA
jgi:hypothetical protein